MAVLNGEIDKINTRLLENLSHPSTTFWMKKLSPNHPAAAQSIREYVRRCRLYSQLIPAIEQRLTIWFSKYYQKSLKQKSIPNAVSQPNFGALSRSWFSFRNFDTAAARGGLGLLTNFGSPFWSRFHALGDTLPSSQVSGFHIQTLGLSGNQCSILLLKTNVERMWANPVPNLLALFRFSALALIRSL